MLCDVEFVSSLCRGLKSLKPHQYSIMLSMLSILLYFSEKKFQFQENKIREYIFRHQF